jgi:hypothetical protein
VDAEIAGQRTMISYSPDLPLKKLAFHTEGVELNNVQIAPLKEQWFYGRVSSYSTSTLR